MAMIEQLRLAGSNKALLLLALVAGLIAAVLVFVAASGGDGDKASSPALSDNVTSALVATQVISPGTEITADMVKVVDVPNDLIVAGVFAEPELVVGDVARVSIAQGEQITNGKIGVAVPDEGLSGVIPAGLRAVGIRVEEVTAVGGLLLPGDRVDVVAAYRIKNAPGLAENEYILRIETFLQNVEVLSVAQSAQQASAGLKTDTVGEGEGETYYSGRLPDDLEDQPGAISVTVALSPDEVAAVVSMQQRADKVWLTERAFGDTTVVDLTPHEVVLVE